ncbi:START domain-containing protein [Dyadobacter sp. NIV53]|uniref:START domain-containing protein n=1 Tax=Dyadobacter sp. NIV53 TaxID=2861765 RepID=UPI001C883684|nr:START domain-containing protein [Dyadobacter sp. NIV53]
MHKTIILLLFFCFEITSVFGQSVWKLVTEEEGITVFSKVVPGSKIKALKVECILKSSASQLVELLLDVNTADQWVYRTKSCVLLKKVSASELYYYSEVSLPWPLENRDFVAHIAVSQHPATKVITVDAPAIPGWVEDKKGIVRINHSKGLWIITPIGKEKVKLEYTLQVDPGGIIPAWAVNMFAAQGPIESFKNMKKQLQLPRYKNVVLGFIKD